MVNKIEEGFMVTKERLAGLVELFEIGEEDLHVFGQFPHVVGPETATGMQSVKNLLDFFCFPGELLHDFQIAFLELLVVLVSGGKRFLVAEVALCKVHHRDAEQGAELQEVADFGLGSSVLIGSDIAPVETDFAGQLFLTDAEPLAEQPNVLMKVNRVIFVNQVHNWAMLLVSDDAEIFDPLLNEIEVMHV